MDVEIIDKQLMLDIYGFSGTAVSRDYAGTAFTLMDKTWQTVKSSGLKNKGLNIWVYEPNNRIFAGVELDDTPKPGTGLEQKRVILKQYAYYKHIGPYNLIKQAGLNMKTELTNRGFETSFPYIEVYGHWTNDESKLETELLMHLQ